MSQTTTSTSTSIAPTISVALCTYNGSRYLREQLESIKAQTHLPQELVICDDCSTDDTAALVAAFAAAAPFEVRFEVNERNLGSTLNFERAIQLCQGEIIALCDQDDVWRARKLARIAERFAAQPQLGLVWSDADLVDKNLQPLGGLLWNATFTSEEQAMVARGEALEVMLRRNVVTGATAAFRASFKDVVLPIPTTTHLLHDGWIALIISMLAPVGFIDEPLISYRQHANQQLGVAASLASQRRQPPGRNRSEVLESVAIDCAYWRNGLCQVHTILLDRLLEQPDNKHIKTTIARCEKKISYLDNRATHYRARAQIARRGSRAGRLQLISSEFLARRYNRYSNGLRGALTDLLQLRF